MKYFIGADLGTSSLKLLLTDVDGQIINSVTKDYFFYKTDNSIPAVQKGKLVTKIESYEETDSNGLT